MNEEIEYAEMLEIPVSTVNVVRKNQHRKKQKSEAVAPSSFYADTPNPEPLSAPLKDSLIAQVNDRLSEGELAQRIAGAVSQISCAERTSLRIVLTGEADAAVIARAQQSSQRLMSFCV